MKIAQIAFQQRAIRELRQRAAQAMDGYTSYGLPQVISYSAPTGAGKTIIMGSLIEEIFYGNEMFAEQPDAIFVWLSDSPELNQQSKDKIDTKSDRLTYGQTETINEASFNLRVLSDGKVYFLNTQKLSTSSLLTKHGDTRQWTIWETLANTVEEKGNRLYFIIDEAHRGTQGTAQTTATTIMQKFLKGSAVDGLPVMPVVIGVTATPERFDRLAAGLTSTVHKVVTTADEVRSSGLLKDVIEIGYPSTIGNEMSVLQTATDEWIDKCRHWEQYCREQHYAYINPVMVVQVQNGSGSIISSTDLDDCLRKIEERCGCKFEEGEVVHTFGQTTGDVIMNGLAVRYEEPSRIADDMKIKVVFFKENLSTGWDCPRAETMVSFRHASDATYIAQLLGRMIRTPRGQRIQVDESLNNVWLFLPFFDERTLHEVVEQIQSTDGAGLPTSVDSQQIGNKTVETLTVRTRQRVPSGYDTQHIETKTETQEQDTKTEKSHTSLEADSFLGQSASDNTKSTDCHLKMGNNEPAYTEIEKSEPESLQPETFTTERIGEESDKVNPVKEKYTAESIDREGIINAINAMGLETYEIRTVRINNYLNSLFSMAHLLVRSRINTNAVNKATQDVVQMIAKYVESLRVADRYDDLAKEVMQYKLNVESLDVYGKALQLHQSTFLSTTDLDLDRQVRQADAKLAREGLPNRYGEVYYSDEDPNACKIDVILFTSDSEQMAILEDYARKEFHRICDETRLQAIGLSPENKKKYDEIVANGDKITVHNFSLPIEIQRKRDDGGTNWPDHLYVHPDTHEAIIKLNTWEADVIKEERQRADYVCWVRNVSRNKKGLVVPYEMEGTFHAAYPDFLIVRKSLAGDYIVDILEPHDSSRKDNLPKAKGFAKYAKDNPQVGRFQLIRQTRDASGVRYQRLDLAKSTVQEAIQKIITDDDLTKLFSLHGEFEGN